LFDILSPARIQELIQAYGLWVLFAVVMFESMGIPVPGETALVTTALYAGSTHRIGIVPVIIVAAAAAVAGDNIGYVIGRSVGLRLLERYGNICFCDTVARSFSLDDLLPFSAPSLLSLPEPTGCAGSIS
jgi:membrane protein DedA with SNARE-associated domain